MDGDGALSQKIFAPIKLYYNTLKGVIWETRASNDLPNS